MAKTPTEPCAVPGCPKFARCRGWCSAHYARWKRNGDPGQAGDGRVKPKGPCLIVGCPRIVKARGWCATHYACWRTTGNPIPQIRTTYGLKRRTTLNGYEAIYEPSHPLAMADGYVLEHRKVAWDAGLFTDPSLHIHHKDEDKQNNKISNLEPKTASAHHREHIIEAGTVTNQFGTFPLVGGECQVEGCSKPVRSRGWCSGHHTRFLRSGDPLGSAGGSRKRQKKSGLDLAHAEIARVM